MKKLLLFITALFFGLTASAQVTTSSIGGNISDQTGEPVIGATVLATHTPSGTEYGTVVDAKGNFHIVNMRPGGPYVIKVQMLGYKTSVNENIHLTLGENFVLKVTLGEETTGIDAVVITKASENSILNSDRTGAATSVNTREISLLPTISRSLSDFTRLTPQAGNNGSFGGRDTRYNNVSIDGAQFSQRFGLSSSNNLPGGDAQPISLDAIQEISVNLTPFDIRQSNFTGANINAVTKSGDNFYQGTLYSYWKPEKFTGDKVEKAKVANAKTSDKKVYGLSLGGPIVKNKLFFFINGEIEKTTKPGNQWRPSENGKGDPANKISRTTIADMEKVYNYLKDTYDYDAGTFKNFRNFKSDNFKILARIDWNIHKNHKLMVRYNEVQSKNDVLTNNTSTPGPSLNSAGRNSVDALSFSNAEYGFKNTVRSITGELNSVFGSKIYNKLLVTYTYIKDERTSPSKDFPFVDIMKDGKGYMSFGTEIFTKDNLLENKTFSITDNVTFSLGDHMLTAGASYEHQFFNNVYKREGTSYYRYGSVDDFIQNKAPIMFAYQLPYPNYKAPGSEITFGLFSAYVQDEWQASPRLKFTAGLRLEVPLYLTDLKGPVTVPIGNDRVNLKDLPFDGGKRYDMSKWPSSKPLISPRLGFNYDVLGDRSIQLRGGTGIFTGMLPFVWFTNQPGTAGFSVTPETVFQKKGNDPSVLDNLRFSPDYMEQVFGTGSVLGEAPTPGNAARNSNFAKVSDDFKLPQVWRTSLAVDVKLPYDMIFTLEGIYSKDINAIIQRNVNLPSTPTGRYTGADSRAIFEGGKQYKDINSFVILENTSKGFQSSLTAQLTKNFSHGFSGMVAYTYSYAKDLSANPGSVALSAWRANASVDNLNYPGMSYSNFAMPHRVNAYIMYSVTWLKHLTSTFSLYYNGTNQGRISYVFSNDINRDGFGQDLIYVPKDISEMRFVDITTKDKKISYSAEDQAIDFDRFIKGNKYLNKRRGKYAQRYGDVQPWVNRFDFKFVQDVFSNFGSNRRYVLQFTLDIFNVGNLLNKDWGVYKTNGVMSYENFRLLTSKGANAAGEAQYTLNLKEGSTREDFKKATKWVGNANVGSTWAIQLGARLKF